VVNNVATQEPVDDLTKLSTEQWDRTFRVNIYSYFWTTRAALRHLPDDGVIINTASINGLRGDKSLIDYVLGLAVIGGVLALIIRLPWARPHFSAMTRLTSSSPPYSPSGISRSELSASSSA
jgi:NAD(P)-dependent dehydrogenase (short-subunit alcohol dehydrogenase family)